MTVFDNMRRNALAQLGALPSTVRVLEGDILDAAAVARAASGQELVVHLAAIAGTRSVDHDAVMTSTVNVIGTLNCLTAGANARARRCVVFSTSEVYGRFALDVDETAPSQVPPADDSGRWGYAASKLAAEHLALGFHRAGRIETVVVRPFNIYGPRQVGEGAVGDMVAAAVRGGPIVVKGDGTQIRSWCYIDDLISATFAMLEKPGAAGRIFNIGNPDASVTSDQLAGLVARLAGGVPIERVPAQGPDVQERRPSIERASGLLGFRPSVGLEDGVRRTMDWHRSQR